MVGRFLFFGVGVVDYTIRRLCDTLCILRRWCNTHGRGGYSAFCGVCAICTVGVVNFAFCGVCTNPHGRGG